MKKTFTAAAVLAVMLAFSLTGCSNVPEISNVLENQTQSASSETADAGTENRTAETGKKQGSAVEAASVTPLSNSADADSIFTERDLAQTADTGDAAFITVFDGKTIDITDEGVYVVSGSAKECTIRVAADDSAKVQIVLDGVSITNSDFPAIYAVSADKVFITTTNTENTLTVTGAFKADGETNTDAVIFSKDDLVLNGTGTLNVNSNSGNGITCKDDMKITGGTYVVRCALDAFEANDSISVKDGTFTIETEKDGFHCENDNAEGEITVFGGVFDIKGGSDGMQACALLEISGGTMNIVGAEGLEATFVRINDGTINIQASDDGINASTGTNAFETAVEINGGKLTIAVGQGDTDAIDSNGSIYVNGGTIDITAQMSSFDYDRTAEFNGGTIIINGEEVSEIPQSMMGGGRHGGMFGGGMNGDMPAAPEDGMGGGRHGKIFGGKSEDTEGGMPDGMPGDTEGGMMYGGRQGGRRGDVNGESDEFKGSEQALFSDHSSDFKGSI